MSGGFYEDGPWGPIKLTKSNALSTSILAWSLLDAEDAMRQEEPTLVRFARVYECCRCMKAGAEQSANLLLQCTTCAAHAFLACHTLCLLWCASAGAENGQASSRRN